MFETEIAPDADFQQNDVVLTNANLVLEDEVVKGSLRIRNGLIEDISAAPSDAAGAIDCNGDLVTPGLVELHTDNLERHMSPRPGIKWPYRQAVIAHDAELAGVGITTVFDAMRVGSVVSETRSKYGKYAREMADNLLALRKEDALRISHFTHLRAEICSETLVEELAEFGPDDRIGIVSMMDHTPGQRQFTDTTQMRTYLTGKYNMSDADIELHFDVLYGIKAKFGALHEDATVKAAANLGAILASHDDTTAGHVETSAAYGVRLAEFPTTKEAAVACRDHNISVMMGAPNILRGGSHSGNVSAQDLCDAGVLDILSSDYAPASLLAAACRMGLEQGNMAKGFVTVTRNPALAAGLKDRGALQTGLRADLVRIALYQDSPATRGVWVRGARVA